MAVLKIVYLHQYFNTPEMSGGTRSYEMARRMVAAGHEVHVVTSFQGGGNERDCWVTQESGICIHWLPVCYSNYMSYGQRIKAFFDFAIKACGKAKEIEADVVFATSTPLTIAIPGVVAARKHKVPMVFEVRDLWPELPIAMGALNNPFLRLVAKKLERWAYRNSAAVVALSPGMKAGVMGAGYSQERIAVVPNGSDNAEFAPGPEAAQRFREERPWLKDRPLLVYTGTFGKINGVGYMVELAKELKAINSEIRILLVGDGLERPEVIERAKREGVFEENLFFEDKLPKKEIPVLLAAATMASSLFVDLPEMRHNSANKFFDALASGTPVMINYGGWMHDLVNRHGCGLAAWKMPISEVAAILEDKIADEEWLSKSSSSAKHLAEHEFDRDKLADQLIKVLEQAANGGSNDFESIAPGVYY